MSERSATLLARAHTELEAARVLVGAGFLDQATSRAYYAAFFAAEAALLTLGESRIQTFRASCRSSTVLLKCACPKMKPRRAPPSAAGAVRAPSGTSVSDPRAHPRGGAGRGCRACGTPCRGASPPPSGRRRASGRSAACQALRGEVGDAPLGRSERGRSGPVPGLRISSRPVKWRGSSAKDRGGRWRRWHRRSGTQHAGRRRPRCHRRPRRDRRKRSPAGEETHRATDDLRSRVLERGSLACGAASSIDAPTMPGNCVDLALALGQPPLGVAYYPAAQPGG